MNIKYFGLFFFFLERFLFSSLFYSLVFNDKQIVI